MQLLPKEYLQLLKDDEGLSLKPYRCTSDKLTIGYGRNLEDVGISEKEADYLLNNDVVDCIRLLQGYAWFNSLNEARQYVIINMVFNLGLTRFLKFTETIKALKKQDYLKASLEMLDSQWAQQVKSRATRLSNIMCKGEI